jgi:hypothetical protein
MTTNHTQRKRSGRPRSYSPEQLAAAIASVRNVNQQPTPELISKALSEMFEISATIRPESLAREIEAQVEVETQLREDTLIRALSDDVSSRIEAQFAGAKRLASLVIAEELERLSKMQLEREMSASRERAMLVAQNQELEAELEDERVQKAELEEALAEAKAEKVALGEQIRTLEQEIQKLQAAGDARSGIVAELERLFDTHRGALREPRQPQV